ncbi:MAG TPA: outer membrane lipoprotein-sorting protein [Acidobacteriaceae bacterium]|nr:outer membrane lipoprotein-sorting protein [Acidobacteriaceae bacterium]
MSNQANFSKWILGLLGAGLLACPGSMVAAQKDNATMTNPSEAAAAASGSDAAARPLTVTQIVDRLAAQDKRRAEELKGYSEERHYTVTYHGFPMTMTASLVVEATYDAPATKHFQILSETGSKLLADKVLKRLLATEEEAAQDPQKTALTPANYEFALVNEDTVNGRRCYVLQVTPRNDSKLLYRGKIWVDAEDYAVAEIEAQPAQNPSFWIRKTLIHHEYAKVGPFWLAEKNESRTEVRMGGTAVLSIDYGKPKTEAARTESASLPRQPEPQPSGK